MRPTHYGDQVGETASAKPVHKAADKEHREVDNSGHEAPHHAENIEHIDAHIPPFLDE